MTGKGSQKQHTSDFEECISLQNLRGDEYWREVFNKYDRDHDGVISFREFRDIISSREYKNEIPPSIISRLHSEFDRNHNGYLSFAEFIDMIHHPQLRGVFGHFINRYVNTITAKCRRRTDSVDGAYEDEYTCWPPALVMVIVSLIQVAFYFTDEYYGDTNSNPVFNLLIYNPFYKAEIWRFFTYMVLHNGIVHLTVNIIVQILLGTPLEMVHGWWRVLLIYVVGVLAGSLFTSVVDPNVYLVGASGGSYALITAHVATIILNWKEMDLAIVQLGAFITLAIVDIGNAIWYRYVLQIDRRIAYAAHFGGALAGLLVGLNVLRNLQVTKTERIIKYLSFIAFVILMVVAVLWNVLFSTSDKKFN